MAVTRVQKAGAPWLELSEGDFIVGQILINGREQGYARLEAHGDIREVLAPSALRSSAIETHLEAVRAGHLAILASPVHAEAREAAAMVLEILKSEGKIEERDHAITRIMRLNLEGPELKDPLHYQEGRVISFHSK